MHRPSHCAVVFRTGCARTLRNDRSLTTKFRSSTTSLEENHLLKCLFLFLFFGAKQRKIIKQFPGISVDWNEQAYKRFHLIWASRLRGRGHRQRLSRGQKISEPQVWGRISKCKCGPFLPLLLTKLICFSRSSAARVLKKKPKKKQSSPIKADKTSTRSQQLTLDTK